MTITSSLKFLYIFGGSGQLCGAGCKPTLLLADFKNVEKFLGKAERTQKEPNQLAFMIIHACRLQVTQWNFYILEFFPINLIGFRVPPAQFLISRCGMWLIPIVVLPYLKLLLKAVT